ncbi:TonB-dependent siderophore receptor [Arcobacter nitrofigilis DSM 7299]|uniref:TonB-dependent siderophore receptor n=1 Tax=Arcobacter nitrofigilis (strain ATCC 33309 / DSM 7299 / CCUG 15893 / LMG 7604 / NCTC 12251 / CI) TaxID=572480 RepID=D5V6A4_ARCNC|nr:TonB-dependent siderophore receptor [Arcobacter nitrofigilis]ADG94174.1 TonB-dependent siderophore receptor [Arcobacter nitrofigilis DSM 7299]
MKKKLVIAMSLFASQGLIFADQLDTVVVQGAQESYFEQNSSSSMKGESSDKKTPYTVSVTKGTLIDDLQAQRIEDTFDYTTGVTKVGKNADAIMIRGFDLSLENIKVNGMSGLISRMGSPSTANVERIEVVKGPTSVLYGAMQPGGLVNIVTKRPQSVQKTTLETSLQTYMSNGVSEFGSDNGITTTLDTTGPINENLFYRFIAVGEKLNSYRDNVDFKNLYIYPSLLWNASDNTSLLVAMEYGHEDGSADDGLFVANHDISTAANLNTVYQEKDDYDNDEGKAFDINLDHYISDNLFFNFDWRSVFHTDERKLYENKSVNQGATVSDTTLTRRNRHQYNERDWHSFDTNLNLDTIIADMKHSLTFGLAGNYRKTDYDRIAQGGFVTPNINIYNPIHGGTAVINQKDRRKTQYYSTGVYLQDKISLTDKLTLVGSARVDKTKIDFECSRGPCVSPDKIKKSRDFVGSIGTIYNINDVFSVYGSLAQSYDPSSAERTDTSGNFLDTEKSKQYEIGTKINVSKEFNTGISFYKINKENVAEQISGTDFYEISGEVESKGVELEVQWLPTANWQFKSGYAYNKAKYVSGKFVGNTQALTPEVTAYIFTRYNIPKKIYDGRLGLSTGISYRDKIYTNSAVAKRVELPSYARVDVGAYYSINDWDFSLNIENITDKKYYESGREDNRIFSGEPRKFTINIKRTF